MLQFISAIESPLKAAGYNVQVVNVAAVAGSILVTSTTEFLDGSTTGAADFKAALNDDTSVSALFPSSVYGTVKVASVTTESVSNPSKSSVSSLQLLRRTIIVHLNILLQVEPLTLELAVSLQQS